MYHFVWIPKYRHKIFEEPYRSDLKTILLKIGYDYDIEMVELEVLVDHIHTGGSFNTETVTFSNNAGKSMSAKEFFKLRPEIKRR